MNTSFRFIRTASFAALLALAVRVPVAAAQRVRSLARATVPFAFQYGTRVYPAGKYTLDMISDNILEIHGKSSAGLGLVEWAEDPQGNRTPGKLVFHHDGDRFVLRDIWLPELSAHVRCPEAKQRKHQETVATKSASSDVEVALLESPR